MATLGRTSSLSNITRPEPLPEPISVSLTNEQVTELLTFWRMVDTNGDNFVDVNELDQFLVSLFPDAPGDLVQQVRGLILSAADRNGDGKIDVQEFIDLLTVRRKEAIELGILPATMDDYQPLGSPNDQSGAGLGMPPPPPPGQQNGQGEQLVPRIIAQLNGEEIDMIRDCFIFLDTNGDGFVDRTELMNGVASVIGPRFPDAKLYLDKIFDVADRDMDGKLSLTEFLASFADGPGAVPHEVVLASVSRVRVRLTDEDIANLQEAFVSIDRNQDGYIDRAELLAALKKVLDGKINESSFDDVVAVVLATADADHDGKLNLSEFIRSFQEDQGVLPAAFVGYRAKNVQRRLSPEQLSTLRQAFEELDKNNDGFVDYKELFSALSDALRSVLDESEIEHLANDIMFTADRNKDQKLTLTEFIKNFMVNEDLMVIPVGAAAQRREETRRRLEALVQNGDISRMVKAFAAIDENQDGYLQPSEAGPIVALAISQSYPELSEETVNEVVAAILSEADTDGDGRISLEEFVHGFVRGYGILPLDMVREVSMTIRRMLSDDERAVVLQSFIAMDKDGDGFVSRVELFDALSSALAPVGTPADRVMQVTEYILSVVDVDSDGKISLKEFIRSFELDQDVLPTVGGGGEEQNQGQDGAAATSSGAAPAIVGFTVVSANGLIMNACESGTAVIVLFNGAGEECLRVPAREIAVNTTWSASEYTARLVLSVDPNAPANQQAVIFDAWETKGAVPQFLGRALLTSEDIFAIGTASRQLALLPRDNEADEAVLRAPTLGTITVNVFQGEGVPQASGASGAAPGEPVAPRPKSPVAETLDASSPTTSAAPAPQQQQLVVAEAAGDNATPARQSTTKLSAKDDLRSPIVNDVSGCLLTDAQLRNEFRKYDSDGSGVLNKQEFKKAFLAMEFFGLQPSDAEFERSYRKICTKEGVVTFDEFCIFMLQRSRM